MIFKIYRDCDSLRLRKIVLELRDANGELINKRRIFGFRDSWWVRLRIRMVKRNMLALGYRLWNESTK